MRKRRDRNINVGLDQKRGETNTEIEGIKGIGTYHFGKRE